MQGQPPPVEVVPSGQCCELAQELGHPVPLDELLSPLLALDESVPPEEELLVELVDVGEVGDAGALEVCLDVCRLRLAVRVLAGRAHLSEDVVAVVVLRPVLVPSLLADLPHQCCDHSLCG